MGSFTTGIGLISGLDSASIIEQILLSEGRGRFRLQARIAMLQEQQAAMLGINSKLLSLHSAAQSLGGSMSFGATTAHSSMPSALTALTGEGAVPGSWSFVVSQLASHHQVRSTGHASIDGALGLESFIIDRGDGGLVIRDIDLTELNGGAGIDRGHIEMTVGSTVTTVDLSDVVTLDDVLQRLNESGAAVTASTRGQSLFISSTDDEAISIRSLSDSTTAEDLGLTTDGADGSMLGEAVITMGTSTVLSSLNDGLGVLVRDGTPDLRITTADGSIHDITIPADAATVGDVLQAIETGTGGQVQAAVDEDGLRIKLTDAGGGSAPIVEATAGNQQAVIDLGFATGITAGSTLESARLIAGHQDVLLSRLHGGEGIVDALTCTVTDRSGASCELSLFTQPETVQELIEELNKRMDQENVSAHFELNASSNGLRLVDDTGLSTTELSLAGDLAVALGLSSSVDGEHIEGADLQHQSVSGSTLLASLNGGHGVGNGSFTIRDATGMSAEVSIGTSIATVDDLLELINSKGLSIEATLNASADGIELVSTASESDSTLALRVESTTGTAAADLRLLGEAGEVFGADARIDGGSTLRLDIDADSSLQDIVDQLAASGSGVTASLVNTGSGTAPWHLVLQSDAAGAGSRFFVDARRSDGSVLDLTTTVDGADAIAWLGDDPADGLLLRSTSNTMSGMIPGVTLDLLAVSDDPVVITVTRDDATVVASIRALVDACNAVLDGLADADAYDPDTGLKGALFGNPTVSRIERAVQALLQSTVGDDPQLDSLRDIGITFESGGRLAFDEARCTAMLASDPAAVESLFNASADDGVPGDTRGFATRFTDLLGSLTDPTGGALAMAGDRWERQIDMAGDRIGDIEVRLERRRLQLEYRFAAMEMAIASMQSQSASLLAFGNSYASMMGR
jgi:flagellar hook-associated protein 2